MMINQETVRYIADLARIALTDDELGRYAKELAAILGYIDKLEKLPVADVEPTSHALAVKNVYRDDVVQPSLTNAEAVSIAVAKHNGSFKVPLVIE